jgi:hypothetical protein
MSDGTRVALIQQKLVRSSAGTHFSCLWTISAVEFVSDRILRLELRGQWCDTVLNVRAQPRTEVIIQRTACI